MRKYWFLIFYTLEASLLGLAPLIVNTFSPNVGDLELFLLSIVFCPIAMIILGVTLYYFFKDFDVSVNFEEGTISGKGACVSVNAIDSIDIYRDYRTNFGFLSFFEWYIIYGKGQPIRLSFMSLRINKLIERRQIPDGSIRVIQASVYKY